MDTQSGGLFVKLHQTKMLGFSFVFVLEKPKEQTSFSITSFQYQKMTNCHAFQMRNHYGEECNRNACKQTNQINR